MADVIRTVDYSLEGDRCDLIQAEPEDAERLTVFTESHLYPALVEILEREKDVFSKFMAEILPMHSLSAEAESELAEAVPYWEEVREVMATVRHRSLIFAFHSCCIYSFRKLKRGVRG